MLKQQLIWGLLALKEEMALFLLLLLLKPLFKLLSHRQLLIGLFLKMQSRLLLILQP